MRASGSRWCGDRSTRSAAIGSPRRRPAHGSAVAGSVFRERAAELGEVVVQPRPGAAAGLVGEALGLGQASGGRDSRRSVRAHAPRTQSRWASSTRSPSSRSSASPSSMCRHVPASRGPVRLERSAGLLSHGVKGRQPLFHHVPGREEIEVLGVAVAQVEAGECGAAGCAHCRRQVVFAAGGFVAAFGTGAAAK